VLPGAHVLRRPLVERPGAADDQQPERQRAGVGTQAHPVEIGQHDAEGLAHDQRVGGVRAAVQQPTGVQVLQRRVQSVGGAQPVVEGEWSMRVHVHGQVAVDQLGDEERAGHAVTQHRAAVADAEQVGVRPEVADLGPTFQRLGAPGIGAVRDEHGHLALRLRVVGAHDALNGAASKLAEIAVAAGE
jgi:hypothetical protein